jgi:hypothetical protein
MSNSNLALNFMAGAMAGILIGNAVSAGMQNSRNRDEIARRTMANQVFSGVVLGDRGNLEHGLSLLPINYPWRSRDEDAKLGHAWLTWFWIPMAILVAVTWWLASLSINGSENAQAVLLRLIMPVLAAPFVLGIVARSKQRAGRNRMFMEDLIGGAAPEYWRQREAVRLAVEQGHMGFDEARFHLTNTWLGHYYQDAPAAPMSWTINAAMLAPSTPEIGPGGPARQ